MKKTNKKKNIFSPIVNFFDKILISPITKLILKVNDYFKDNNHGFERILNNRQALIIISLLFALVTFYIIDQEKVSLVDDNAEIIYGVPVTSVYNEEAYVIEGLPETVDVTLIGKKWNVYLAKQYPAEEISVDLSDLGPGTHKVNLNYKQNVSSVTYKVDPSQVTVVVYRKISMSKEVSYDIVHKDSLDAKLNIDNVTLNKDKVTIKGAEYKLNQVASVKALIDIDKLTTQEEGTQTLKDIPMLAYDVDGKIVDVEIVPETLEAEISISSPSKKVPIKIETQGELDGKSIKSLTPSVSDVTIYGSSEALEKIEYLTVPIDISGVTSNKNYTINLTNPSGVRDISVKTITVKLEVDEVYTTEINNIKINITNLKDGYIAQAADANSSSITVIVKGSESVIKKLDPTTINAYVNLEGLGVGTHEVEVKVTGDDNTLLYTPRVKKVSVTITKK